MEGFLSRNPNELLIIAEVSGNHCRDFKRARKLIAAAKLARADFVKFQTFTSEEIAAPGTSIPRGYDSAHDAWLDGINVKEHRDMFAYGGLPREWHKDLKRYAEEEYGLVFLSTPFSVDAARFLVEDVGVQALKIASGDVTFTPLLEYARYTKLPVILSTGGATLEEIAVAVQSLSHQRMHGTLGLLHCVSAYPCPPSAANLRAILTMGGAFPDVSIGWSSHVMTDVLVTSVAAVAMGARILEFHINLCDGRGIDAGHSLVPQQFKEVVDACRATIACLGSGVKAPHALELHDRIWARRDPSDWLRPTRGAREGRWQ